MPFSSSPSLEITHYTPVLLTRHSSSDTRQYVCSITGRPLSPPPLLQPSSSLFSREACHTRCVIRDVRI